jgi:hypothetical protein
MRRKVVPDEISEKDIIWIDDATKEYGVSRGFLDKQIEARKLSVVHVPPGRRVYLLRSELNALLKPRIVQPRQDESAG